MYIKKRYLTHGVILGILLVVIISQPELNFDTYVFAKNDERDQSQRSGQNSQCVSGENNNNSCNNISINKQGGDGDGDGKNHVQVSGQNSQCVSGENNNNSCNNINLQYLLKKGLSVLGQR